MEITNQVKDFMAHKIQQLRNMWKTNHLYWEIHKVQGLQSNTTCVSAMDKQEFMVYMDTKLCSIICNLSTKKFLEYFCHIGFDNWILNLNDVWQTKAITFNFFNNGELDLIIACAQSNSNHSFKCLMHAISILYVECWKTKDMEFYKYVCCLTFTWNTSCSIPLDTIFSNMSHLTLYAYWTLTP